MFNIAILNPLRFIDTSDINNSFDGNFAIDQVLSYQNPKCYFQKWQTSDVLRLQVISDFVPTDLLFKNIETDGIDGTGVWVETPTVIVGQTFKVYELEFEFLSLPAGKYYTEFSYTDENSVEHILVSEPICVAQKQENTLLLQYKNSINDLDTIFDTGIVFNFRVESAIKDFTPGNNRAVYVDQNVNATLLSAVPFRKFNFYLGFQYGLPEWVVDKVNFIQSVDQVKYNNVYYQIVDGAEYDISRNDDNSFAGGFIEVQPTNNNFNRYTTIPSEDGDNIIYNMGRRSDHFNIGDNFNVPGVFKSASLLEQILVTKRGPAGTLTIKFGTTPGGSEIGEFDIDDTKFIETVPYLFTGTTTVYVTGLDVADVDVDIQFLYLQTDAPPIDLGNLPGPAPVINLGKNATIPYIETMPGEFDLDFDIETGLGRPNTKWVGWAIADGRNGTTNLNGKTLVGVDLADSNLNEPKKVFGSKTHTLTEAELPQVTLYGYGVGGIDGNQNGGGLGYNRPGPKNKEVSSFGGGLAHNIMQPSLAIWYVTNLNENE